MDLFVATLKQQVKCPLCNECLNDPKLLECFHAFCSSCIKAHIQVNDEKNSFIRCRRCYAQTFLQDLNDVENLLSSPVHSRILKVVEFAENQKICSVSSSHPEASWQCLDCHRSLCKECLRSHSEFTQNHQVVSFSDMKKEEFEAILRKERPCPIHNGNIVEFQCQDCHMLICMLCLTDHHYNHKTTTMQEVLAIQTDSLTKNLENIERMSTNQTEKKQQEEIALNIKRDAEQAKLQVKELTEHLIKALKNNEQRLLNDIQENIMKAESNLRLVRHTTCTDAQEYVRFFIENAIASEMIDTSQHITYKPFNKVIGGLQFKPNKKLGEQVKHGLGLVLPFKRADPKMSSMKVVPSDVDVTKKAKLVIELKTTAGEVTQEPFQNLVMEFTPENYVSVGEMQITDEGETTVDFIPRVSGRLTVDVKVQGKRISNSPLVIKVKPQQMEEVTGNLKLKDALNTGSKEFTGIAVNKSNSKIAVADHTSHHVRVFDMDGDLLLTYGSSGSGQEQLQFPQGLAFLNETDLVIADSYNHRICIINTTTGQLVRTFGTQGNGNGQFKWPCGVVVNDDSNIIVCDIDNCRVQVFTKDGDYLYQFKAMFPHVITTHNGLFYVSGSKSAVSVIEMNDNQSPTTITTIGGKDYSSGHLQDPWGLAIDNDNNLLVCDSYPCFIYKFTCDGGYIGQSSELGYPPRFIAMLNNGQAIFTKWADGVFFLN